MANERKVPILRSESSLIEQEFDSVREKFEHEMSKMEEEMSRFRSQMIASERDRLISSLSSMSTLSTSKSRSTSAETTQQEQQEILEGGLEMAKQSLTKQQQQQSSRITASQTTKSSSTQSTSSSSSASLSSKQQSQQQTDKPMKSVTQSNKPEKMTSEKFIMDGSSVNWLNEMNSPLIREFGDGKVLRLRFDVKTYEPEQILVKTVDNRLQIHAKCEETSDSMSMYREYNREFLLPEGIDPELIRSSLSADGILTVEAPLPTPLLNQC